MTAQYKSEIIFCLVFSAVVITLFGIVTLDRRNPTDNLEVIMRRLLGDSVRVVTASDLQ